MAREIGGPFIESCKPFGKSLRVLAGSAIELVLAISWAEVRAAAVASAFCVSPEADCYSLSAPIESSSCTSRSHCRACREFVFLAYAAISLEVAIAVPQDAVPHLVAQEGN